MAYFGIGTGFSNSKCGHKILPFGTHFALKFWIPWAPFSKTMIMPATMKVKKTLENTTRKWKMSLAATTIVFVTTPSLGCAEKPLKSRSMTTKAYPKEKSVIFWKGG